MKNLEILLGNIATLNHTPLPIFDEAACAFLGDFSARLLKSPMARQFTDLSALAFWCRPANIQQLKNRYQGEHRLGRGVCLHIAPSNIPVNAIFSYFFGLLAGNANIVRLPSKTFTQVQWLCGWIKTQLENYPTLQTRTAFVRYERDSSLSAELSKMADCRMIWGGDQTVQHLKSLSAKPRTVDIAFPDRYSIAIINAEAIKNTDEATLTRLAQGFYNDTFLMDQNACSSPQLICWLNDDAAAREKFWQAVLKTANEKYDLQDALCVEKFTHFCQDAICFGDVLGEMKFLGGNLLYLSEVRQLQNVENLRGKGGYFYEYALKNIADLLVVITEKFQTITYFGVDAEDLQREIIAQHSLGIDRIVPIGQALDIGILWDGHDLIRELSRVIALV